MASFLSDLHYRGYCAKPMAVNGLKNISQLGMMTWVDNNGGDSKSIKFTEMPFPAMPAAIAQVTVAGELPNEPALSAGIVTTHPATGQKILFVNPQFTVAIKGMRDEESRALLNVLYMQAMTPEYQFRFHWKPNSMVFWDNRGTQHYAANDYYPNHRTMQRVTIIRERTFSA